MRVGTGPANGIEESAHGDGSVLAPAFDKLIRRRDPHREVGIAEVDRELIDRALRPIDLAGRRWQLAVGSPVDDPPDPAAGRGRGRGGSAGPRNGR